LPDESQLRRRFSVDTKPATEGESNRGGSGAFAKRQHTKPIPLPDPGPGFVINEPEPDSSGVPTPRPRLPMSLVPKKLMDDRKVLSLPLDHRAGFVLAHIDGVTNIRTMTDVCGMTQDELSEVVERLVDLKVIKLT